MDEEPVLIVLGGLGTVVSLGLVASNTLSWTHLDGSAVAAIVAFIIALTGLIAAALRGEVWSPASHERAVTGALYTPAPLRGTDAVRITSDDETETT
jgi:hypothetical protein